MGLRFWTRLLNCSGPPPPRETPHPPQRPRLGVLFRDARRKLLMIESTCVRRGAELNTRGRVLSPNHDFFFPRGYTSASRSGVRPAFISIVVRPLRFDHANVSRRSFRRAGAEMSQALVAMLRSLPCLITENASPAFHFRRASLRPHRPSKKPACGVGRGYGGLMGKPLALPRKAAFTHGNRAVDVLRF